MLKTSLVASLDKIDVQRSEIALVSSTKVTGNKIPHVLYFKLYICYTLVMFIFLLTCNYALSNTPIICVHTKKKKKLIILQ